MRRACKTLANCLTASRMVAALVVLLAAFLGDPQAHLLWVIALVVTAWTTDMFDGWLARHSGITDDTWLSRNDLFIDATLAAATLVFLTRVGWLAPVVLVGYVAGIGLLWLCWRSQWVWNGFNTGSHLIALGFLWQWAPQAAQLVLLCGGVVLGVGYRRVIQLGRTLSQAVRHALVATRLPHEQRPERASGQ
jgi:phosphatidylglycerophosphate synthase